MLPLPCRPAAPRAAPHPRRQPSRPCPAAATATPPPPRRPQDLPPWGPLFRASVNPLALAYVGDAVWSLSLRGAALVPPQHPQLYQAAVRAQVTAEAQAALLAELVGSGQLSAGEEELVGWAQEAAAAGGAGAGRARFAGGGGAAAAYHAATAFEALVGYWHLSAPLRLHTTSPWLLATAATLADRKGEGPAKAPSS